MFSKRPRIRKSESSSNQYSYSSGSKKNVPRTPYTKAVPLLKRRCSYRQQKSFAGMNNKANIINTAMLLTPSSSDNSLTASLSLKGRPVQPKEPLPVSPPAHLCASLAATPPGAPRALRAPLSAASSPASSTALKSALPTYLSLKRQQSSALVNFQARKSRSQMDLKEARRIGNYQLISHVPKSNALVPTAQQGQQLIIKDDSFREMLLEGASQVYHSSEGNVRFVVNGNQDMLMAGLRVFNTVILSAYRQRRDEVRNLKKNMEEFNRKFVKNRNQLHLYNTLFLNEKRRADTLNDQLKQLGMESSRTKLVNDELNARLEESKLQNDHLRLDNFTHRQDVENLRKLLKNLNKELFQTNVQQHEQLEQLTRVQVECQTAKFDIEELTVELNALKAELAKKQEYVKELLLNIENIAHDLSQSDFDMLEQKCEAEEKISQLMKQVDQLELDNKQKKEQITTLQNCLAATVGQRIRQCFAQRQVYQNATCRLMHFFAYCMLPGTPPPALPISSIPAAVKKLRGLFHGSTDSNANNGSDMDKKDIQEIKK